MNRFYSLLSFHNLIIHEGLKLESQVSLKILRKLSPLSIKHLLDAFEKIDLFLARTKNFHIVVADLEQLEEIVAVDIERKGLLANLQNILSQSPAISFNSRENCIGYSQLSVKNRQEVDFTPLDCVHVSHNDSNYI